MKSGSLTSGKRSPACTTLQCLQSDLLLSGAVTQVRSGIWIGLDVNWEKVIGCTGIQIWKWHLDSAWEIQSSPWETRLLYTFRSYWNSDIHSFPLEREGSSGRKLVSLESFSSRIHKVPASPGWWLLSKGAFLLTSFPFATRMVPRKAWWQWLEQAAKVGRSSAVYPLSSKWELYNSFILDLAAAYPPDHGTW